MEDLKKWVNIRIDYWEGVCEKHPEENRWASPDVIFDAAIEIGQEKGILDGFYQVMEFIEGHRR